MNRRECYNCYGTGRVLKPYPYEHETATCYTCQGKCWIVPMLAKRDRFYEEDMKLQFAAGDADK